VTRPIESCLTPSYWIGGSQDHSALKQSLQCFTEPNPHALQCNDATRTMPKPVQGMPNVSLG